MAERARTDSPDPAPSEREASPTILVVEDEVLIRLAIADYLRECGYRVFEAGSVDEAQRILGADTEVKLVFSDVQMHGTADGFVLASWIRRHHPGMEVLLTSGLIGIDEKARDVCHEGPVVAKPYDQEAVLQRVRELLRSAEKLREGGGES